MMRLASLFVLAVLLIAGTSTGAIAKRHHAAAPQATACDLFDIMRPCAGPWAGFGVPESQRVPHRRHAASRGQVIGHPTGCPRRLFCGCGAAVEVFGSPVRSLWKAAAWLRFPRTSPATGMVAARYDHVFVLREHLGGNTWIVYDANSGGHATRIHPRSIAGYTIVNPHA